MCISISTFPPLGFKMNHFPSHVNGVIEKAEAPIFRYGSLGVGVTADVHHDGLPGIPPPPGHLHKTTIWQYGSGWQWCNHA